MAQTEDKRQTLIDMVQGNGTYTEETRNPDGTTAYKLHRVRGDYHEVITCRNEDMLKKHLDIIASDL